MSPSSFIYPRRSPPSASPSVRLRPIAYADAQLHRFEESSRLSDLQPSCTPPGQLHCEIAMNNSDRVGRRFWTVCQVWRRWNNLMQDLRRCGGLILLRTARQARAGDHCGSFARRHIGELGPAISRGFMAAINNPNTVEGILGGYRAGLHAREDRTAGRPLTFPLHVTCSLRDDLAEI